MFITLEDVALATADTVSSTTLLSNAVAGNSYQAPQYCRFRKPICYVTYGAAATRCMFLIRKVPAGYTAPNITVATSVTDLADVPNVVCYGMLLVNASNYNEVEWRMLRPNVKLNPGDNLYFQAVTNTNSAGQTFFATVEMDVSL